jgi:hypothetical protein
MKELKAGDLIDWHHSGASLVVRIVTPPEATVSERVAEILFDDGIIRYVPDYLWDEMEAKVICALNHA